MIDVVISVELFIFQNVESVESVIVVVPVVEATIDWASVGENNVYNIPPIVEFWYKTAESDITNGPALEDVEIFPALSIPATWNQNVPLFIFVVVVALVVATPTVVVDTAVPLLLSKTYKYSLNPDPASIESVQEIFAEVIIVPVALELNIVGVVGAFVSGANGFETVTTVEVETDPLNAVTVVVPLDKLLNKPEDGFIVPTVLFELTQITEAKNGRPYWSKVVAVNCVDVPTITDGFIGEIIIEVSTAGAGATTLTTLEVVAVFPAISVEE